MISKWSRATHVPPPVWWRASLNSVLIVLITAYFVAISAQIRIAKENKLALQIWVLHPSPKPVSFLLRGQCLFSKGHPKSLFLRLWDVGYLS